MPLIFGVLVVQSNPLLMVRSAHHAGVPEFVVGFEQIRPSWLVPVGAVGLLACGKPVAGARTFGGTNLQLPVVSEESTLKVLVVLTTGIYGGG